MKRCNVCGEDKDFSEFWVIRPKKSGGNTYSSKCKKCHYATYRDYYAKVAKERWGKYRAETPKREKMTDEQRKESKRSACRKWYKRTMEESPEAYKKRRNKVVIAYQKRRKAKDPEYRAKVKTVKKASDLNRKGVEGRHTKAEWDALKEKYNHCCACCGKHGERLTKDHVKPLSKGGTNNIDNIQPLCRSCNSKKWTQDTDYR